MTVIEDEAQARPADSLLAPAYRLQTIGVVIVITVVAIEAMSVATAMPTVARSLHGLRYYSWGFTSYLLADVIGMVDAGRRCDRFGPRQSLLGGLTAFAGGLFVASAAPDIWVFLAGRVLQGLGGGSMIVAAYVVVGRAFPDRMHPRVFSALSAAWVVPSLVGPALAGVVTASLSWRWVFGGIAPLAIGGALLLVPVLRAMPPMPQVESSNPNSLSPGIVSGVLLAAGLGLMQAAGESVDWWSIPLLIGGVAISASPLISLLPAGALRLARGLPTVVVLRGILTCAFFGAEAYLPLTLTRLHGGTPRVVGIPLTLAALGWSAGSWWQGHRSRQPLRLLRHGFAIVAIGIALLIVMTASSVSLWFAVPIWALSGGGMGLAMPTISVRLLELSPEASRGANSAALQISDMVGSIIGIALAGALVNGFGLGHLGTAMVIANTTLAGVAAVGVVASRRAE